MLDLGQEFALRDKTLAKIQIKIMKLFQYLTILMLFSLPCLLYGGVERHGED